MHVNDLSVQKNEKMWKFPKYPYIKDSMQTDADKEIHLLP